MSQTQPISVTGSYTEVEEPQAKRFRLSQPQNQVDSVAGLDHDKENFIDVLLKDDSVGAIMILINMSFEDRHMFCIDCLQLLIADNSHLNTERAVTVDKWKAILNDILYNLIFGNIDGATNPSSSTTIDTAYHFILTLSHQVTGKCLDQLMPSIVEVFFNVYQQIIKNADLNDIAVALLESIEHIWSRTDKTHQIFNRFIKYMTSSLQSSSSHVRSKCLHLAGLWCHPDQVAWGSGGTPLWQLILYCTEDNDSRVRNRAYSVFLSWKQRELALMSDLYQVTCRGLKDEEEQVRMVCVRLLCVLVDLFPEVSFSLDDDSLSTDQNTQRLADHGFCQLCLMMQDTSLQVRALAASLLGSIAKVNESFLLQTLDKKVMSDLKIKKSTLEKSVQEKAEWSTGRQWAADAPIGDSLAGEEFSLVEIGACGAVIHGLEDEFKEVRLATIESVHKMATRSTMFAVACQDFLVDMLTDDLESVRIRGVLALSRVGQCVVLRLEQLNIVMGALQEGSGEMRRELHNLLAESRLSGADCLMPLVDGLLKNLKRYPQDKDSIWKCASHVGENHPELVSLSITRLLNLHPYLRAPEPRLEDSAYITVLLLVFHAIVQQPGLSNLLPPYVKNAQVYLREVVPHLIPSSEWKENSSLSSSLRRLSATEEHNERDNLILKNPDNYSSYLQFFKASLDRFRIAIGSHNLTLLRYILRDFSILSRLENPAKIVANFLKDLSHSFIKAFTTPLTVATIESAILYALKVEYLYSGMDATSLDKVRQYRLQLCVHKQKMLAQDTSLSSESAVDKNTTCQSLAASAKSLADLDFSHLCSVLKRMHIEMRSPSGLDTDVKFPARMGMSIRVRASVTPDDWDTSTIRVCVRSPDGRMVNWEPSANCWQTSDKPPALHLKTDVQFSANQWSDAGQLEVWLSVDTPLLPLCVSPSQKIKILPQPFRRVL